MVPLDSNCLFSLFAAVHGDLHGCVHSADHQTGTPSPGEGRFSPRTKAPVCPGDQSPRLRARRESLVSGIPWQKRKHAHIKKENIKVEPRRPEGGMIRARGKKPGTAVIQVIPHRERVRRSSFFFLPYPQAASARTLSARDGWLTHCEGRSRKSGFWPSLLGWVASVLIFCLGPGPCTCMKRCCRGMSARSIGVTMSLLGNINMGI